jgi:hypothetical protein
MFLIADLGAFTTASATNLDQEEQTIIQFAEPIFIDGLPPLMCEDGYCQRPLRMIDRDGRDASEADGWWQGYGPDLDWNGMDDRLQRVLVGSDSISPTAIIGEDGRKTVAIVVDFAWHPDEVDQWYLGVYADAVEWVQMPNTRGMSQWADGGIVATKPYVSAAAYIHKMSNYCGDCQYDKKKRVGDDACPFNSLYWNFLDDKKEHFAKNNRMAMMLRLLEKIPAADLAEIKKRAYEIITQPDAF